MINSLNVQALYVLYPDVIRTEEHKAFDAEDNEIEYDLDAVEVKAAELQAQEEAKQNESLSKLAALGLTPEDLQRILGK